MNTQSTNLGEICINKKISWCWQTARHVSRSVKVTKYSTIPYVGYSFVLCSSNVVFNTRRFYDIRLQKMSWPWNRGQRSLMVLESGIIRYIVYAFLLVFFSTLLLEMHRFQHIRLLSIHWPWNPDFGSVEVIGNVTMWQSTNDFLLTLCGNYGSISCRFWDMECRKMSWSWNSGQRSLKVIEWVIIR